MTNEKRDYVAVTWGFRGYFAVLVDGETHEPIQTGVGSYETADEASVEAHAWAESNEHACRETLSGQPTHTERIAQVRHQ